MERRAFLATVAGAGTAGLAGCSLPGGPTTLSNPSVSRDDSEVVMAFGDEADPVARATIDYRTSQVGGRIIPFRYFMWHRPGTTVDSLRLAVQAPTIGPAPPSRVYLAVPNNGEIPDVELFSDDQTGVPTIQIDDLGIMGEGTFGLKFYLEPTVDNDPLETRFRLETQVTESGLLGSTYTLEGTTSIALSRTGTVE